MSKTLKNDLCILYTTFTSKAEAEEICTKLLEQKLIACANIMSKSESIYIWDGDICNETEYPTIIKTTNNYFERVSKEIKDAHSYDTPCLIKIKIEDGEAEYLKWLEKSVKKS